jgi:hypothetical protein
VVEQLATPMLVMTGTAPQPLSVTPLSVKATVPPSGSGVIVAT